MSVEPLPEWMNIEKASDRVNDLMRQNWALLNEAIELFNSGDYSPMSWLELQDIFAECIDIDVKYATTLTAETEEFHRSSHAAAFGENHAQVLGWE